ncbi:MAG TPA: serine hydrolase [Gaiellaceae bacterium]|nr:serine hydrolase [Gaiellaceae bacterium]
MRAGGATVAASLAALALLAVPAGTGAAPPPTWKSRVAEAARYAGERAGTVSFAVVDEAGRLHGLHRRAVAPSASVLKAMLLVAYLRRPDVRHRALAAWERQLLAPMIRRSDNAAASRMVGLVGEARLNALAGAAGMEHFRLHLPIWGQSEITPRGQARFFDRIASLLPPRHRRYALHLLATVVPAQRWGVGRVTHGRWRLYFKGGWGSGTGLVDHQVARYGLDGERFALALFTRFNPDHAYGKETLRGLARHLLAGVARPGERAPATGRLAVDGRYSAAVLGRCGIVSIRSRDGEGRRFETGAGSCAGFRLVSAGPRALWSWPEGGTAHLATATAAGVAQLGSFDNSDPLGRIAGGGGILAFQHGSRVTTLGGPDCPAPPGAVLAAGAGLVAAASGGIVQVRDPATCALERSLNLGGNVTALALEDDLVAVLVRGSAGRMRLERLRISTAKRLQPHRLPRASVPELDVHGPWILSRTRHALRASAAASGRTWTVWRPRRAPVGAGLSGRRILWVENHADAARFWSLRLPPA